MAFGPPDDPCDMCIYSKNCMGQCEWEEEDFEEYENDRAEYLLEREEDKYEAGFED